MKTDCETVGIEFKDIDSITVKEVICAYRKQALHVHPDKNGPDTTAAFQALNNSYQRILKFVLQRRGSKEENDDAEKAENDVDEKFMNDNFESFNFPHENYGSFTVMIQHAQADSWQDCLERVFGQPIIKKNNRGTECDRYWKRSYKIEDVETDITVHLYNKPKNKKSSKLMIQGGIQSLYANQFLIIELIKLHSSVITVDIRLMIGWC